jgi:DNA-binding transcriptional ArsR family regulator
MRNGSVTLPGMDVVDVATAIGDPVRRQILDLLRRGPMTAGTVANRFAISRPAVSRHLRVLRASGLVRVEARGRERIYHLDVGPLAELDAWLAPFRSGWAHRLDALDTEVHRTRRDRRRAEAAPPIDPPTEEKTA